MRYKLALKIVISKDKQKAINEFKRISDFATRIDNKLVDYLIQSDLMNSEILSSLTNKFERNLESNKAYKNPDNDPRGLWQSDNYKCNKSAFERPNLYYAIIQPNTGEEIWPSKTAVWRYNYETHQRHIKEDLIWWGKDGTNSTPRYKRLLSSVDNTTVPQSVWLWKDVGHNQDAKREVLKLDPSAPFSTPKPEKLIQRIIHIGSNEGDLVLDSFLGSATTSAVALKMNRKFIGIELDEHAVTHAQPRLKKVVDGEQGGISEDVNWTGSGGFKFYRLGEVIFNEDGSLKEGISFDALASHIWYGDTHQSLEQKTKSPLLGIHNGIAYYLLYKRVIYD